MPLQEAGRLGQCVQALVNPSDEALFNLRTAMSNQSELRVLEVLAESDEVGAPPARPRLPALGCPLWQAPGPSPPSVLVGLHACSLLALPGGSAPKPSMLGA